VYAVHYGHDALLRWALQNGCAEASSADYASDLGTDDLEDSDDGNSDGDGSATEVLDPDAPDIILNI